MSIQSGHNFKTLTSIFTGKESLTMLEGLMEYGIVIDVINWVDLFHI